MSIIFTSPKGGTGTTVTAAAHALLSARRGVRTVLVDLCGDIPATLGMPEPNGPGVNDWLGDAHDPTPASLLSRGTETETNLLVVHRGRQFVDGVPAWNELARFISTSPHQVVIDAGAGTVPADLHGTEATVATVVRPCYLALRRAIALPRPVHTYIVKEDGRALTVNDVVQVLGAGTHSVVPHSAAIARAVDAGLLPSRVEQLFGDHIPTPRAE